MQDLKRHAPTAGRLAITLCASLLLGACASTSSPDAPLDAPQPTTAPPSSPFVTTHGSRLFADEREFEFRAVNFSNGYLERGHEVAAGSHHTHEDFNRVRQLGFNTVRFGFNGYWFERDRGGFLAWLDANVEAARQQELKLILDLHTPIGGFWLDPDSPEKDFSLWTDVALQSRNIELWQTLAERYKDEPVIAAYDLLNEPVTIDEDGSQWRALAGHMVAAIRKIDPHHLIVVERLYGVRGRYGTRGQDPLFLVDDANVLYDSHFYEPVAFTHEGSEWNATQVLDGGVYPDENALIPTGAQILDDDATISTRRVDDGTTEWQRYSSEWTVAEDKKLVAASPGIAIHGALSGIVYFDDLRVFERDTQGVEREVLSDAIDANTIGHWYDWQRDTAGSTLTARRVDDDGATDQQSLALQLRGTGLNTTAGWSNNDRWFRVTPGHAYRIEGAMRGKDLRYISGASTNRAGFEINFYKPDKKSELPVFHARNRDYLAHALEPLAAFARQHAVPVSVLSTGITGSAFGPNGRGGELWLQDLVSVLDEYGIGYGLWNYHDERMGIYTTSYLAGIGKPNRPLINTLLQLHTGRSLQASMH